MFQFSRIFHFTVLERIVKGRPGLTGLILGLSRSLRVNLLEFTLSKRVRAELILTLARRLSWPLKRRCFLCVRRGLPPRPTGITSVFVFICVPFSVSLLLNEGSERLSRSSSSALCVRAANFSSSRFSLLRADKEALCPMADLVYRFLFDVFLIYFRLSAAAASSGWRASRSEMASVVVPLGGAALGAPGLP